MASDWANRIVGHADVPPGELLANPKNWRVHPKAQQDALTGALDQVGWVQRVIVNRATGNLVDGHLRVQMAVNRGASVVPVTYVDLTEQEEALILASLDPIGAMAATDDEKLRQLMAEINFDSEALSGMLEEITKEEQKPVEPAKPKLAERFIVPPFSVLDGRAGYWRDRKKQWLSFGIKSEIGREGNLAYRIKDYESWNAGKKRPDGTFVSTSVFDPVLTELVYRWFSAPGGKVFDPFAGGSVRGIVAAITGRDYTGIELRPEQVAANRQQAVDILQRQPEDALETTSDPAALTPVQRRGDAWVKRDDAFVFGGVNGGKVRTCLAIARKASLGLVTAGARQSPQANLVARVGKGLGLPVRVHCPSGARMPEMDAAEQAGAEVVEHFAGRNTVIIARAREDAAASGWTEVPFGMESPEAIEQTRRQVANIPEGVRRIVVSAGSGTSLSGILHGLADAGRKTPVIGVVVGSDPSARLDKYAPPNWREQVTLVKTDTPYEEPAPVTNWRGVELDAYYEAKAAMFVEPDDCLWVICKRQTHKPAQREDYDYVPRWIEGDSRNADELAPGEYDLVFSCPPYANKEVYSDDPLDLSTMTYPDFLAAYREIIKRSCAMLRENRFAAFVVGEVRGPDGHAYLNFVGETVKAFEDAGMRYYNEAIVVTPIGSAAILSGRQMKATRKLAKVHQNLLVFVKGDPAVAADASGIIEMDISEDVLSPWKEDE